MKKNNVISTYNGMSYQLLPNIGFTNVTNFRSTVCNTDNIGLRFNDLKENYISIFDENKDQKKPEIILTGGSTAMGMAASSDIKTISSLLSKSSNFHFYNLAVRAYNGFQELIMVQSLINNFTNLKKIFILSGINDLYFFLDPNFSKRFPGPQVYGNKLFKINKEHLNFFKRIKFNLQNNKKMEIDQKISLEEILSRNLRLWSLFAKSINVEVIYFLQPFCTWNLWGLNETIKHDMKYGKNSVMMQMDNSYKYLKNILFNSCDHNSIKFVDLNEFRFEKDIFVDRVHLNDNGFTEIAEIIKKYI